MKHSELLMQKLKNHQAKVGVIGIGYVGLPIVTAFAEAGFVSTGFDVDSERVQRLQKGDSYIPDVSQQVLKSLVDAKKLFATQDFIQLGEMDAISVCVPTPLRKTKDPDISYIVHAVEAIRKTLRPGQLVILESTTYPGTTDEVVIPMLEETGLKSGQDFFVAFSPERINPGDSHFQAHNTPKIIGGSNPVSTELARLLYESIIEKVVPVSSTRAAEMVKLLENTFRAVNIGMVNEFALICQKLGLDVWEIIDAAATKPFGYMPFYPGPGLGGHCIPIDPLYLSWKMKSHHFNTRFIELADTINSSMPQYVVNRLADALNEHKKPLRDSRILLVGLAYKKDITDGRESPALDILQLLQAKGAQVEYQDNFIPKFHQEQLQLQSVPLHYESLKNYDAVVITTNHSYFSPEEIARHSRLILDCRNLLVQFRHKPNVFRL